MLSGAGHGFTGVKPAELRGRERRRSYLRGPEGTGQEGGHKVQGLSE